MKKNQKTRKKVCFIDPKFLKCIGGMETHAYEFARYFLNDSEYKIDVIFSKKNVEDGINVDNKKRKKFKEKTKEILTGNVEEDSENIIKNSSKNTRIYFFNNITLLPIAKKIKQKKPFAKIIMRSGGNDIMAGWLIDETDNSSGLLENRKEIVEMINNYVDFLIVNSKYSFNRSKAIGINKNKLKIFIGGTNCKKFSQNKTKNKKKTTIGLWARLVRFKGIDFSLKAVKEVYKTKKDIEFIIIGKGPEEENLKNKVKKLGIEKIVRFKGGISYREIPSYLKEIDIFLHMPIHQEKEERGSSYIHTETMGRSYCEAASKGIPSIGTMVGGVPEVVKKNKTGLLVKEKDYISASKKLHKLIENKNLREKIGKKARKYAVNNFDWKILFNKYKKLFKNGY